MKVTHVYSEIPVDIEADGPDLSYRISGELAGFPGSNQPTSIDIHLPSEQRTGWIDVPDRVIADATYTGADGVPPINLTSPNVGVIFTELSFWESNTPEEVNVYNNRRDGYLGRYSSEGLITGSPTTVEGTGNSESFEIELENTDPRYNGEKMGFRFEISYTLENAVREVIIAGNANGDPVADACEGGELFLFARTLPGFTGGVFKWEKSDGSDWVSAHPGQFFVGSSLPVPAEAGVIYRVSLLPQFGLGGEAPVSPVALDNVTIFPSVLAGDINTSVFSACGDGSGGGSIRINSIRNIPTGTNLKIQLDQIVNGMRVPGNTIPLTTLPYTFNDLQSGQYVAILTVQTRNGEDISIGNCSTETGVLTVGAQSVPVVNSVTVTDLDCENEEGKVEATFPLGLYEVILQTPDGNLLAQIGPSFSTRASFGFLFPGEYQLVVKRPGACTGLVTDFTISELPQAAGGDVEITFQTAGFAIRCEGVSTQVTLVPEGGTGDYEVDIYRFATPGTPGEFVRTEFIGDGGQAFILLGEGSYEARFKQLDDNCVAVVPFVLEEDPNTFYITNVDPVRPSGCGATTGMVKLTVVGGGVPYTGSIGGTNLASPMVENLPSGEVLLTFNGIAQGVQEITVTENSGCTVTQGFLLPTPENLTLRLTGASQLSASCDGSSQGTIVVEAATGAIEPMTYRLSTQPAGSATTSGTFDNLEAGTYTVIGLSATGCETQINASVQAVGEAIIDRAEVTGTACASDDGEVVVYLRGPELCTDGSGVSLAGFFEYTIDGGQTWEATESADASLTLGQGFTGCGRGYVLRLATPRTDLNVQLRPVSGDCATNTVAISASDFTSSGTPYVTLDEVISSCDGGGDNTLLFRVGNRAASEVQLWELTYQGSTLVSSEVVRTVYLNGGVAFTNTSLEFRDVPALSGGSGYAVSIRDIDVFGACTAYAPGNFTQRAITPITISQPAPLTIGSVSSSASFITCDLQPGTIVIDGVTGGVPPYQYAADYSNSPNDVFRSASSVTSIGEETVVAVRDSRGCVVSQVFTFATGEPSTNFGENMTFAVSDICTSPTLATGTFRADNLIERYAIYQVEYSQTADGGQLINPLMASKQGGTIPEFTLNDLRPGPVYVQISNQFGCNFSSEFEVPDYRNQGIIVNTSFTTETCDGSNNATINVDLSGGAPPYEVTLNGSTQSDISVMFSGLDEGTYAYVVTDVINCRREGTVTVAPPAGTMSLNSEVLLIDRCNSTNGNGSFGFDVIGGQPPYTITPTPQVVQGAQYDYYLTGLMGGQFDLNVQDANGCVNRFTIDVPIFGGEVLNDLVVSSVNATSCTGTNNGSLKMTFNTVAAGLNGGQYRIQWLDANGFSEVIPQGVNSVNRIVTRLNLAPGRYPYIITSAAECTYAGEVVIGQEDPTPLTAELIAPASQTCAGEATGSFGLRVLGVFASQNFNGTDNYVRAEIVGDNGFQTVAFGGLGLLGSSEYIIRAEGLPAGNYRIDLVDPGGCDFSAPLFVSISSAPALAATATVTNVSCPEFANGSLTVSASGGVPPYTYGLTNFSGTFSTSPTFNQLPIGEHSVTVRDANGCEATVTNITIGSEFPPITASATATDVSCFGANDGILDLTISGGNPPYRTSIFQVGTFTGTQVTGLAPGTYDVLVLDDNNCRIAIGPYSISEPDLMVLTTQSSNGTCGEVNGSVDGFLTGGVGTITYTLNGSENRTQIGDPTFTGLANGSYFLVASDENGCEARGGNFTISNGNPLTPSSVTLNSPDRCGQNTGSVSVSAPFGPSANSVSWSNGATDFNLNNLAAGTYDVTITNLVGCTKEWSIEVPAEDETFEILFGGVSATTCGEDNGSLVFGLNFSMQSLYTYQWSDIGVSELMNYDEVIARNDLAAGTYVLTVTSANGCSTSRSVTIGAVDPPPALSFSGVTEPTCGEANGTLVLSGAEITGPATYAWSHDDQLNSATASGLSAGSYSVTIVDDSGCSRFISTTLNGSEALNFTAVSRYNDPCFIGNLSDIDIEIGMGAPPFTITYTPGTTITTSESYVTLSDFVPGTVTVQIISADGCSQTQDVTVDDRPTLTRQLGTVMPATCSVDGGSVTITLFGLTDYSAIYAEVTGELVDGERYLSDNSGIIDIDYLPQGATQVVLFNSLGCTLETYNLTVGKLNDLSATATVSDIGCGDAGAGTITLVPSGGTEPYTYSLADGSLSRSTNQFVFPEGRYSFTVSDASGCAVTVPGVTINTLPDFAATVSSTDFDCTSENGGQIVFNVSEGVPPYTYTVVGIGSSDNPVFTGLAAGTYDVSVVDDNGCSVPLANQTITGNGELSFTFTKEDLSCGGGDDGSITINPPTGDFGSLTYSIDGGAPSANPVFSGLAVGSYTVQMFTDRGCVSDVQNVSLTGPTDYGLEVTDIFADNCGFGGGGATISANVILDGFTFEWSDNELSSSNQLEGVSGGNYSVTVTTPEDCEVVLPVVIPTTNPPTFAGDPEVTNTTCGQDNGQITINIASATGEVTYEWDHDPDLAGPVATNLVGGESYFVTISDESGCLVFFEADIEFSEGPFFSTIRTTAERCGQANGSITLTPFGFEGNVNYVWDHDANLNGPVATGLTAGSYTVTAQGDGICSVTETLTILDIEGPSLAAPVAVTNTSCGQPNGAATVTVTGGVGQLNYNWSSLGFAGPVVSGLAAGDYTVSVTDQNNCEVIASFSVGGSGNAPFITVEQQTDAICGQSDGTATITSELLTGTLTYNWAHDANLNGPLASGLATGSYPVTVSGDNGCSAQTTVVIGSIEGPELDGQPVVVNTTCGLDNGTITVNITGGTGVLSYAWSHDNNASGNSVSGLPAGDYQVSVTDENSCQVITSVNVTSSEVPTITILQQTDANCGRSDGTVTISTENLTGLLTYVWSHDDQLNDAVATGLPAGIYVVTVSDENNCSSMTTVTIGDVPGPELDGQPIIVNTSCGEHNGTAIVNATGGTGTLTYNWSHDGNLVGSEATDLSPWNYTVSITDENNCEAVAEFSILESESPTITIAQQTDATCGRADGTATITTQLLTGTLTYTWAHDPGLNERVATGLVAGSYPLTVTGDQCSVEITVMIDDISGPELIGQAAVINTTCGLDNGSVTVNVSGGTGNLTYTWAHDLTVTGATATGLAAGNYELTISDENDCEVVANASVGESEVPLLTVATKTEATCGQNNGSASMEAAFLNGPLTYTWSHNSTITGPTASNLAAGAYSVTVTGDNDCSAETTFSIDDLAGPELTDNPQITDTSCGEDNGSATVTLTGGIGLLTYAWSHDDAIVGPTATDLAASDYEVTVTDENGCELIVDITILPSNTPLIIVSSKTDASCGADNGSATVNTQFLTGPLTYDWVHDNTLTGPTANNLAPGNYSVTVSDDEGCSAQIGFLIESLDGPELAMATEVINTICGDDNGSATVFATGGTGELSYNWSHDPAIVDVFAIDLAADDYEVTISDENGCEVIALFTLEASETPTITVAQREDATCGQDNGLATVSTQFLTGELTYSWAHAPALNGPTATALAAGVYPVSVSGENGCTVQLNVLIESIDGPELSGQPSVTATTCGEDNGAATVGISGGTGMLTYSWSHDPETTGPTAEGLSAGDYFITITDENDCEVVAALRVLESQLPTVSVTQLIDARCGEANGSIIINAQFFSPPLSYNWEHDENLNAPTATGLGAGTYFVLVTDGNGCRAQTSATIEQLAGPELAGEAIIGNTTCGEDNGFATVNVSGGAGELTYAWNHSTSVTGPTAEGLAAGDYRVSVKDENDCEVIAEITVGGSEVPTISISDQGPASCGQPDGFATVTTQFLSGVLSYNWDHDANITGPTASGLTVGSFPVTVSGENGCSVTTIVIIGSLDGPELSREPAITNTTCGESNGAVTVSVSGGTGTLTYSWSHDAGINGPTAEGLSPDDYLVSITDENGCTVVASVNVNASSPPAASIIQQTDVTCGQENGTATVTTNFLTGALTYSWDHDPTASSSTVIGLAPGTYSVTISDVNDCFAIAEVVIGNQTGPELNGPPIVGPTTCGENNGTVTVLASGGTGQLSYSWNHDQLLEGPTAEQLGAGDYVVTITDENGCEVVESYTIAPSEIPTLTVIDQGDAICGENNGSATVEAAFLTGNLTYFWSHDSNITGPTATGLASGTYLISVTGANGCTAQTALLVGATNGPELDGAPTVVNTSCGENNGSVIIRTNGGSGDLVYSWSHDDTVNEGSIENLAAGDYSVTISDGNGCQVIALFAVGDSEIPSIAITRQENATCDRANGAASVATFFLGGALSYVWSHDDSVTGPLAENLAAGTYGVTVTGVNGCSVNTSVLISNVAGPQLGANPALISTTCGEENGSISVITSGGSGSLTYNWSHDINLRDSVATALAAGDYTVTVTDAAGCTDQQTIIVAESTAITVGTFTTVQPSCGENNGSLDVTFQGGTPPYSYDWSHDASATGSELLDLLPGTYTVVASDVNGCSASETIILTDEGALPEISISATASICEDGAGTVSLAVSGSTVGLTFAWSHTDTLLAPVAANLTAGSYSVTISNEQACSVILTSEVMLNAGPTLSGEVIDPDCAGVATGSIQLTISGGTGPMVINWDGGSNASLRENLAAGNYSVTVADVNGCTVSSEFELTDGTPVSTLQPTDTTLCLDDIWVLDLSDFASSEVTGSGGFASTDPVVLIEEAGTYRVNVVDSDGCTGESVTNVLTSESVFVAGMVVASDVVISDSVVILETSFPAPDATAFIFNRPGVVQIDQIENQYWFRFPEVGEFEISLLADSGGCTDVVTKVITVHADSTSIPTLDLSRPRIENVVIRPNPNDGRFAVDVTLSQPDEVFLNIYGANGLSLDRRRDTGESTYTFNFDLSGEAQTLVLSVQTRFGRFSSLIIVE